MDTQPQVEVLQVLQTDDVTKRRQLQVRIYPAPGLDEVWCMVSHVDGTEVHRAKHVIKVMPMLRLFWTSSQEVWDRAVNTWLSELAGTSEESQRALARRTNNGLRELRKQHGR